MNFKRINVGRTYQTKQGIGICLSCAGGKQAKFDIAGKVVWLPPKEVEYEIPKGEEPKAEPDAPIARPESKSRKQRSDADYIALDDAIGTLSDWHKEIIDELAKKGLSRNYVTETLAAMKRVHSPEE